MRGFRPRTILTASSLAAARSPRNHPHHLKPKPIKTAPPSHSARPSKHFSLICWRLLYGVAVHDTLNRQHEIDACRHARFDLARWDEQKAQFPREWTKLLAKRQRRLQCCQQHGSVPDGWTPPNPKDPRRTAHKPLHAYLARRGMTLEQFRAKYARVPMGKKKGGHQPPWKLIRRISAWLD